MTTPRLVSVNVGRPRPVERNGKPETTAIWKQPVEGRVAARGVNLDDDDQADRSVHGGPDKAIYVYAVEDTRWWETKLGRTIDVGGFGENFTTEGVDVSGAVIGERWSIGHAAFEVSEPRLPCWKLGVRMGDAAFVRAFTRARRPGAYLRIVDEGDVGAGDEIRVLDRPGHGVTVTDVMRIHDRDRQAAADLLSIPQLSDSWHDWARRHGQPERAG